MKKYIVGLLVLVFLSSCGVEEDNSVILTDENTELSEIIVWGKEELAEQTVISVTSSIVPIASVVNAVGGEYVDVNTIVPAGVSPHGFDLSAQDVVAIKESEIAFIIGLEQIDGFLEKALEDKKHVELAEGMELLKAAAHDHSDHGSEHKDDHHDEDEHIDSIHTDWNQEIHGAYDEEDHHDEHDKHEDEHQNHDGDEHDEHSVDAHIWLGKDNIIQIAEKVRDELSEILPEQAEIFAANAETFTAELAALYEDFAVNTAGKTPREFIVFHDAYNYLMESASIDSDLKIPFSENVLHESGTAHMGELIEEIELHGVVNIFTEPQFSDGNVQKFAQQYNLTVGILDPLGADDSATWYLENIKTNLDNLTLIYE